jgi:LacI family transcriptional regulator, galactose operon repressor
MSLCDACGKAIAGILFTRFGSALESSLVKRPPRVILLIPSAREFDRGLRRGIVEYAHAHGPWIFYEEAPPYLQSLTPRQRLRHMREWKADGVIVLQSRLRDIRPLRLPTVVSIGTRRLSDEHCQVVGANQEIGRMGAQTLLSLGLRQFAYCGLKGLEFSDNRGKGFRDALREAGHEVAVYSPPTRNLGQSWYAEQSRLTRWLETLAKPAGLMACNDDRARMVAEICRIRNIRVPDEIAILGVDNDEQVCRSANPPLSSIELATGRGGYEAAALLAALMSKSRPSRRVITVQPTRAVPRQSTDVLAIENPAVVKALRFARDNSNRNLRVSDLAAAAGLSRRTLQDRFLEYLGRTPMQEIHRCRVDLLSRLLLETNMSIGEIATASGFEIDAHVARFFSRQTGMTPMAYRRKSRIS